jgi:SAM-dependent methyltransferase
VLQAPWKPLPQPKTRLDDGSAYVGVPVQSLYLGFLGDFPCGKRILDLGCGSGHLTRLLLAHENRVLGLDLSAPLIDDLQDGEGLPVERYKMGSFKREFKEEIDFLFCFDVLEHIEKVDRSNFLHECFSLKTEENQFLFSIPRDGHGVEDLVNWDEFKNYLGGYQWRLSAIVYPIWYRAFQVIKARLKPALFKPVTGKAFEKNPGFRFWHRSSISLAINWIGRRLLACFRVFPMHLEERVEMCESHVYLLWVGKKRSFKPKIQL